MVRGGEGRGAAGWLVWGISEGGHWPECEDGDLIFTKGSLLRLWAGQRARPGAACRALGEGASQVGHVFSQGNRLMGLTEDRVDESAEHFLGAFRAQWTEPFQQLPAVDERECCAARIGWMDG